MDGSRLKTKDRSWWRSKSHGRSVGLRAGSDLDRRQGAEDDSVLLDCPPPEPPPWSVGESRVWRQYFNFIICLLFNFHGQTVLFYFYCFLCCKTLALRWGEKESAVTVISSKLPNFGLASYTAFLQVVSSQSRPRPDGYLWFFSSSIPLLNAIFMN
ncbi:unnamed protein product [Cuscuta epithymum]|uniref:Uncharacterized protein n=1 Tax=Cuscuta epithymum TaxID=186058 RepID=A0AAV0CE37_9ASTE|nr:unnamed protein product [Cuscuta epithymum]